MATQPLFPQSNIDPSHEIDSNSTTPPQFSCFLDRPDLHISADFEHLIISLVGLPASGKSFTAQRLDNYCQWHGYRTKIFNLGLYRRHLFQETGSNAEFFNPNNEEATHARDTIAKLALRHIFQYFTKDSTPNTTSTTTQDPAAPTEPFQYNNNNNNMGYGKLLQNKGQIAILDATNTSLTRRDLIRQTIQSWTHTKVMLLWIETSCEDSDLQTRNIINTKIYSPDYKNIQSPDEIINDFNNRILHYKKVYVKLSKSELQNAKIRLLQQQNASISSLEHQPPASTSPANLSSAPHAFPFNDEIYCQRSSSLSSLSSTFHQNPQQQQQQQLNFDECYIRILNAGKSFEQYKIQGYLPTRLYFFLLNIHLESSPVYLINCDGVTHSLREIWNLHVHNINTYGMCQYLCTQSDCSNCQLKSYQQKAHLSSQRQKEEEEEEEESLPHPFSPKLPPQQPSHQSILPLMHQKSALPLSPSLPQFSFQSTPITPSLSSSHTTVSNHTTSFPPHNHCIFCNSTLLASSNQYSNSTSQYFVVKTDEIDQRYESNEITPQQRNILYHTSGFPLGYSDDGTQTQNGLKYSDAVVQYLLSESSSWSSSLQIWFAPISSSQVVGKHVHDKLSTAGVHTKLINWRSLRPMSKGLLNGYTEDIMEFSHPQHLAEYKKNKLNFRFPRGESYNDQLDRLERLIIEISRTQSPVLLVAPFSSLRCIVGYFFNVQPEIIPYIVLPQNAIFKNRATAYNNVYNAYKLIDTIVCKVSNNSTCTNNDKTPENENNQNENNQNSHTKPPLSPTQQIFTKKLPIYAVLPNNPQFSQWNEHSTRLGNINNPLCQCWNDYKHHIAANTTCSRSNNNLKCLADDENDENNTHGEVEEYIPNNALVFCSCHVTKYVQDDLQNTTEFTK